MGQGMGGLGALGQAFQTKFFELLLHSFSPLFCPFFLSLSCALPALALVTSAGNNEGLSA